MQSYRCRCIATPVSTRLPYLCCVWRLTPWRCVAFIPTGVATRFTVGVCCRARGRSMSLVGCCGCSRHFPVVRSRGCGHLPVVRSRGYGCFGCHPGICHLKGCTVTTPTCLAVLISTFIPSGGLRIPLCLVGCLQGQCTFMLMHMLCA